MGNLKAKEQTKKVTALSYEELEKVAQQLSEQSRLLHEENVKLREAVREMNGVNLYKRLDYLWLVLSNGSKVEGFTQEFKLKCAQEFMEIMTIPEEIKEEK